VPEDPDIRRDVDAALFQQPTAATEGALAHRIENEVVPLVILREVRRLVVDDSVGSQALDQGHVRGSAHRGYIGSEALGDLDRRRADGSGCAVDQDVVFRLDLCAPQHAERIVRALGTRSGLLERRVCGDVRDQTPGLDGHVLGVRSECAFAVAAHPVAQPERRNAAADLLDFAREFGSEDGDLWPREATEEPDWERGSSAIAAVRPIDGGGANPDDELVVSGSRFVDLFESHDFGWAIPGANSCFHWGMECIPSPTCWPNGPCYAPGRRRPALRSAHARPAIARPPSRCLSDLEFPEGLTFNTHHRRPPRVNHTEHQGGIVRVAIVYDSRTGTTRAAAEEMARMAVESGHESTAVAVAEASPGDVSASDAVCIGSWTEGWFFFLQHATQATMEFIDALDLDETPAAVFCTYKTSPGTMLDKMSGALEARGARVTGSFRSRGSQAPDGYGAWLGSLEQA